MPKPHSIMMHEFSASDTPHYDDDGDELFGFYYQFIDGDNNPLTALIGPYRYKQAAEKAALRAFSIGDF